MELFFISFSTPPNYLKKARQFFCFLHYQNNPLLSTGFLIVLNIAIVLLGIGGCSFLNDNAKAQAKKEAILEKRKNYDALYRAISSQSLSVGITTSKIRELFGAPDDIFSSGSASGGFEIWTYEKITTRADPNWHHIRLFFNSNKLTTWSY